ncbi:glycosyltransferase family 2 protein [Candidatus Gottesmanbacteria bacterium]|nr:glycosyltransferase family 2 protein [Candidatus Gottesmanbacteria bacterium]
MKVFIIVPAYNEGKTIVGVIDDLRKHGYKNIVVVDDGSIDQTAFLAQKTGVMVLSHVLNRGLGAALGTGWEYALKNKADILVTFDSDGQHKAKDVKNLIVPILKRKSEVVIGSRFLGKWQKMPLDRIFANVLSNIMTFAFYGSWSSDTQSGLRAFGKEAVKKIKITTDRMEVSSEFYREFAKHKLKVFEIPIDAVYTMDTLKNSKQEALAFIKLPFRLFLRLFH